MNILILNIISVSKIITAMVFIPVLLFSIFLFHRIIIKIISYCYHKRLFPFSHLNMHKYISLTYFKTANIKVNLFVLVYITLIDNNLHKGGGGSTFGTNLNFSVILQS